MTTTSSETTSGARVASAPHRAVLRLGKLRSVDVAVVGSAEVTLGALSARLSEHAAVPTAPWLAQLCAWREQHPLRFDRSAHTLKPQRVIDARVDEFEQCYPMILTGAAAVDMVEWPGVGAP
jgi:thiamine pyrophosphate-dependent acetolactate synthase large subunit-like protein